ncbi:MAG: FHA domain-containing protein [Sandaracinaceae bacterium]|nr:FHA domain-containing protein [Sandaracinaceae bacterium]
MGTLMRLRDGRREVLAPRSLLGRTPLARVRLEDGCASQEHAVLEWSGGCWRVRDLGSRNGTSVNHRACGSEWHELVAGDVLRFGGEEAWRLEKDDRPPPAAIGADGALRMGRADLLVLPDDDEPMASVQWAGDGWVLDRGERQEPVHTGDRIELAGTSWQLLLPAGGRALSTQPDASEILLHRLTAVFEVNRSEEHVRIVLQHRATNIVLPDRMYHFLLLVLARARVRDQEAGVAAAEEGWVDAAVLAHELRVSSEKLNVDIFRARRLFAEHGVVDGASVVERRTQAGQVRLGLRRIQLIRH